MAMAFIRPIDARERPTILPERAGKMDMWVQYVVDERRVYEFMMPMEEYTPEKARARMQHDEEERQKIIGQPFVVGL